MSKFKVGQRVYEHTEYGFGVVSDIDRNGNVLILPDSGYPDGVWFGKKGLTSLMLTGRPFNVGDKVVIGGEKGVVSFVSKGDTKMPVNIDIKNVSPQDEIWLTVDGRAWPGTPIIAEHDWEEESESETGNESENHIEDVTVSQEEVLHIAEVQEQAKSAIDEVVNVFNIPPQVIGVRNMTESEFLKEQYNYVRMALKLTGFELDKEAAALITETVKKVLVLGGEFSLDTACEVEARVNEMYNEANI